MSLEETNSVVVLVKVGVVPSHEAVSHDEVVETFREWLSHESHNTDLFSTVINFEDVVLRSKRVVDVVNGEGKIRERVEVAAVLSNFDSLSQFVDELFISDDN